MLSAAKDESVPLLAASWLSENSCPGFGSCDSELRQVIELANALNASGLGNSLYDDRRGSRDTGKERDAESGLDFSQARYYGSALGRFTGPDPSNLSIDFWLPQSWNRYSYVGNNPLKFVDKNGLWWTSTHHQIASDAFPGLSAKELKSLTDASDAVDHTKVYMGMFGPQDPQSSPMHGMSDGTNTDAADAAGVAYTLTGRFIQENEADAVGAQAAWIAQGHTGISPNALYAFGNALHTVEDLTSPAHEDFQSWSGCWLPLCANGLPHAFRERPSLYSGDRKATTIANARQAFLDTFGFMALMHALDGLTPSTSSTWHPCGGKGQPSCE